MYSRTGRLKKTMILLGVCLAGISRIPAQESGDSEKENKNPMNIALGCPCQLEPAPNYSLCKDANDFKDLTDGIYGTRPNIWTVKSTVGWCFSTPIITLDLGKSQPIQGASFSTAAGDGGVGFLRQLLMFVSDDKVTWRYVGDLVKLSLADRGAPPSGKLAVWRYMARHLRTSGRYVALAAIPNADQPDDKSYVFCDEIEVYGRGDFSSEDPKAEINLEGSGAEAIRRFIRIRRVMFCIEHRLSEDLASVRAALKNSSLTDKRRGVLLDRLSEAEKEIPNLPSPDLERFETVLPLNATHRKIFSVYGTMMSARGLPPLCVWKSHRYEFLPYLATLEKAPSGNPKLEIDMLKDEFRADALNLLNASGKEIQVALRVRGLPPTNSWLRISAVPWTDTLQLQPVADALPDLSSRKGVFRFSVPAGVTQKIWFTVDSAALPAGQYDGTVEIDAGKTVQRVPFSIRVSPIALGRPRMSLSMWDYTHGGDYLGITKENRQAAIESMRSHFVNSPWATGSVLPWPTAESFNDKGQLRAPLDFKAFDEWIQRWPNPRHYLIFINAKREFAGADMGTPQFNTRVGSWMRDLARYLDDRKIPRERLVLELVDEPKTDAQDEIIVAWIKAIKAAVPEFQVFENPTWLRPDQTKYQEAITLSDILCPFVREYEKGGDPVERYFEQRAAGQQLWFYQCAGPVRLFDPTHYYRGRAWWIFARGGSSLQFWSFGNNGGDLNLGGGKNSWNEYDSLTLNFAPAFLRPSNVTDSIHWQAVREGVEDYEYLAKLRDRIAQQATDSKWKERAQEVLHQAPSQVMGSAPFGLQWKQASPSMSEQPDIWRLRALRLLEEIEPSAEHKGSVQ
jgi:hypothetical protein